MNNFFERFRGSQGEDFGKRFNERMANMTDDEKARFMEAMEQRRKMFFGAFFGQPHEGEHFSPWNTNGAFNAMSGEERAAFEKRMHDRGKMFFGAFASFGNHDHSMSHSEEQHEQLFNERLKTFSEEELQQFESRLTKMLALVQNFKTQDKA